MAAPGVAQSYSQQMVETEHLFKVLLEQPNGLARRILSKAGSNPTSLLEQTDAFIRRQPKVTGSTGQVNLAFPPQQLLTLRLTLPPFADLNCPQFEAASAKESKN